MNGQGKCYLYATPHHGTRAIGVQQVDRADFYAVCYRADNRQFRIFTSNLPAHSKAEIVQRALDIYAEKRGLKPAIQGDTCTVVQDDLLPAGPNSLKV